MKVLQNLQAFLENKVGETKHARDLKTSLRMLLSNRKVNQALLISVVVFFILSLLSFLSVQHDTVIFTVALRNQSSC